MMNNKIDILYHEGRHFSDYQRFPKLQQAELEFRAKLTELCFAEETLWRRLTYFIHSATPQPSAPHTYAAHFVIQSLSKILFDKDFERDPAEWEAAGVGAVQAAARQALDDNTAWLLQNQPDTVEQFL